MTEPLVWQGLMGGVLIGLAAALMLLGTGRIAGVSGLAARATGLSDSGAPRSLAVAFIVGLPMGALLVALAGQDVVARFPMGTTTLLISGLLVGIGTRLGSGCTSGHGVCGLSRLSKRSIVATVTFMASGVVSVAIANAWGFAW